MLRSVKDLKGHAIKATDGDIGRVQDFYFDDEAWAIRYNVVDTSNWWGGNTVLLAPPWIQRVSWSDSKAFVDLTRESVKSAPRYESAAHVDRQQEAALYEHYGRRDYWTADAVPAPGTHPDPGPAPPSPGPGPTNPMPGPGPTNPMPGSVPGPMIPPRR